MERQDALAALAGLGQALRLDIMRALIAAGGCGLVAGVLATRLGVPANTLSGALGKLEAAGLVHQTREGRFVRYRARVETVSALVTFLMADCCGGDPGQCGVAVDHLLNKGKAA